MTAADILEENIIVYSKCELQHKMMLDRGLQRDTEAAVRMRCFLVTTEMEKLLHQNIPINVLKSKKKKKVQYIGSHDDGNTSHHNILSCAVVWYFESCKPKSFCPSE